MKPMLAIALAIAFSACSCGGTSTTATTAARRVATLTEDEKHRLYSAALAASESPLESEIFKEVCKKIGIFGAGGGPNDNYMAFVSTHVDWALRPQMEQFKQEIDTKEKAREYINQHLPR